LRLLPKGAEMLGFGAEAATTVVDPDGTFTFLDVPAGDYTLIAQSSVMEFATGDASARMPAAIGFPLNGAGMGTKPGAPGLRFYATTGPAAPAWGRLPVSVGNLDLADLVLPLHPAAAITGRVVFAEGVTPPQFMLLFAEPVNGDPSLGNPSLRRPIAATDPVVSFTVAGLMAGTYVLTFGGGLAPVSVMSAGRDVKDVGFDASLGRDFQDVVVTLTNKFAEVTGYVRDDRGTAAAAVIAFPVERERWTGYGWTPARLLSVAAGSNGAYILDKLPEGEYFLVAVDATKSNAWVDPAFLAAAAPHATRISVKWGQKSALDLKVEMVVVK
jgi:hypothetical protein